MVVDDWHGLYRRSWGGEIVDDAYAHPAKYASGLIARIYDHVIEEGWLRRGDIVLDPFSGVGLGALDAMRHGLRFIGVELEQRFVDLAGRNIALWNRRYGSHPGWGSAVVVQGDSQRLIEVLDEKCMAVVTSPPYVSAIGSDRPEKRGGVFRIPRLANDRTMTAVYGSTPGNLGNMSAGDFEAAISSPPYGDGCRHIGGDDPHPDRMDGGVYYGVGLNGCISSPPYADRVHTASEPDESWLATTSAGPHSQVFQKGYGSSLGQLGAMRADGFESVVSARSEARRVDGNGHDGASSDADGADAGTSDTGRIGSVISSPPYVHRSNEGMSASFAEWREMCHRDNSKPGTQAIVNGYGNAENQLAGSNRFWPAARQIAEQVYRVLNPGAHAVWVVKAYIRDGKIVPFPEQWQQMCEAVGFQSVHFHRAWLTEDLGVQYALDGTPVKKTVSKKGFFRRLGEKRGLPPIDYEVVLCMTR